MSEHSPPPFVDADGPDAAEQLRHWRNLSDEEFLWRVKALATWSAWPDWEAAGPPPERICTAVYRWLSSVFAAARRENLSLAQARRRC